MNFADLTPEQMEKAKACKSPDELIALAESEGIELSDKELDAVSGGSWSGPNYDCTTFGCGAWDCSMFGCTTVNCTAVECAAY